jgi:hypothetical protein
MNVLPSAEPLGEVAPGNPSAVSIQDGVHEEAIVPGRHADMALTTRQKLFDPIPLVVPQTITQHLSISKKQQYREIT